MNAIKLYKNLLNAKSINLLTDIKNFVMRILDKDKYVNISYIDWVISEYENFIYSIILSYTKLYEVAFEYNRNLYKDIYICFENILLKCIYNKIYDEIMKCTEEENLIFIKNINKYKKILDIKDIGINKEILISDIILIENIFDSINKVKTPFKKLEYLISIIDIIKTKYSNENIDLILLYLLIKISNKNLIANLFYIENFKSKIITSSKDELVIYKFKETIELIKNLDNKHDFLSITDKEFKEKEYDYYKDNYISTINNNDSKIIVEYKNDNVKNNILITMINKIPLFNYFSNSKQENENINKNEILSIKMIPIESLENKYYNKKIDNLSYNEIEQLYNDFKIILKIIETSD